MKSSKSDVPVVPAVTRIIQAVTMLQTTTDQAISQLGNEIANLKSESSAPGISSEDFNNVITAINCMADRITNLEDQCRSQNNKIMEQLGSMSDRIAVQLAETSTQPCGWCPNEEVMDYCMPEVGESEEPDVDDNIIGETVSVNEFGMIESNHYDEDGKHHGERIIRSRPGDDFASITCTYEHGVLHGRYIECEDNEKVTTTGGYWHGKAEGKWVRSTIDALNPELNKRETYYMRDGKLNGLYTIMQGGQEIENGQYRDGKKHGEWKSWNTDQKDYDIIQYVNGLRNGDCIIDGENQYFMADKLIPDYY